MVVPEEITPEGSVVPVILDTTPIVAAEPLPDLLAERLAEQEAAVVDLMETFGWTEARARAVVGVQQVPRTETE